MGMGMGVVVGWRPLLRCGLCSFVQIKQQDARPLAALFGPCLGRRLAREKKAIAIEIKGQQLSHTQAALRRWRRKRGLGSQMRACRPCFALLCFPASLALAGCAVWLAAAWYERCGHRLRRSSAAKFVPPRPHLLCAASCVLLCVSMWTVDGLSPPPPSNAFSTSAAIKALWL